MSAELDALRTTIERLEKAEAAAAEMFERMYAEAEETCDYGDVDEMSADVNEQRAEELSSLISLVRNYLTTLPNGD